MQTRLLLIRHGQTPWNALGKIQGCTDIDLEEAGILQAQLLSERLNGNFSAIYSSPLKRAYETACILAAPTDLKPVALDALREIHFGKWEGLTFKEVAAQYPDALHTWRTDPVTAPLLGGDGSLKNASLRGRQILLELTTKHRGETIVVVSHGGFIKSALLGLFELPMTMYQQMTMGNTCITTIRFNEQGLPILEGLNDTRHLDPEAPVRCV